MAVNVINVDINVFVFLSLIVLNGMITAVPPVSGYSKHGRNRKWSNSSVVTAIVNARIHSKISGKGYVTQLK